ncbi:hypothetical protein GOZ90_16810 [Agrobacterium vitis]|uniref:Uncharacterized protein n=1 Tax=Agrobacterium vitis TaxID=373 RepID=A0A6L6VLQ5_AGRVI|nr:hypothetical protein [Agrobacterium vitis]MUZ74352.1 hypothetical protein [Agrobacterium vitis]
MPRRKQFKAIGHDILQTFASRYNDLNGYWALGQYVAFLHGPGKHHIEFDLERGTVVPDNVDFTLSALYYRGAIHRMMAANAMPRTWLAGATIRVSIMGSTTASCEIEIVSDLGKTYRSDYSVTARPHDPDREHRRIDMFGPSNQLGR